MIIASLRKPGQMLNLPVFHEESKHISSFVALGQEEVRCPATKRGISSFFPAKNRKEEQTCRDYSYRWNSPVGEFFDLLEGPLLIVIVEHHLKKDLFS
jgi:hypothetical protein